MRRSMLVSCAALALLVSACGGSGTSKQGTSSTSPAARAVSVDVGTGTPIRVKTSKPRIALFWTSGNLFQQAYANGAEAEARRRGVQLTVLDAKFDPLRQMQQVQNALQQKRYDAFVALPLDGNTMCPVLSRQAPAQGIVVVTSIVAMCNRVNADEGPGMWSPGTLAQVGNPGATNLSRDFYEQVDRRLTGMHTAALLNGPPLIAGSITSNTGLDQDIRAGVLRHLDVKYRINTDFTTPDGLAKTQTLLQGHPDVDVILSVYSDITTGAIRAIQAAGKTGKVKVYDRGGSTASIDELKAGQLQMTTAEGYLPYTHGVDAVDAVVDAFEGRPVPRYVGEPGSARWAAIDAGSVGAFRPQY